MDRQQKKGRQALLQHLHDRTDQPATLMGGVTSDEMAHAMMDDIPLDPHRQRFALELVGNLDEAAETIMQS